MADLGKKETKERAGRKKGKKLCKRTTEYEVKDKDNVYFFVELMCYVVSPK